MSQTAKAGVAWISGTSSGIGLACAQRLLSEGWRVLGISRREAPLKHDRYLHVTASVSGLSGKLKERVSAELLAFPDWKDCDVLINNSGLALGLETIDQASAADLDEMIETNIKGVIQLTQIALPALKKSYRPHIIHLGSTAAKLSYAGGAVYAATKAAVDSLAHGMRMDLLKYKIKVSVVHPGAVETEFSRVRFKGDAARAQAVYAGYTPLNPGNVADAIWYMIQAPGNVVIQELVMTAVAQANSLVFSRPN